MNLRFNVACLVVAYLCTQPATAFIVQLFVRDHVCSGGHDSRINPDRTNRTCFVLKGFIYG